MNVGPTLARKIPEQSTDYKAYLKGHSQLWERADLDIAFASLKSVYLKLKIKLKL